MAYQNGIPGGQSEKLFKYLLRPLGSGHLDMRVGVIQHTA